jgi:hypothetical protein
VNAGGVVLNEVGVYPGVDHLYAIKKIKKIHYLGGRVNAPGHQNNSNGVDLTRPISGQGILFLLRLPPSTRMLQ